MTANWKSRAETMLSQFIVGEIQDPYSYSQFLENTDDNSSTSDPPAALCAEDSVYGRLLGCDCAGAAGDGAAPPCASLFLRWARLALGGAIKAYLSSPLCLALLPLVLGAGLGFWAGRRGGPKGKGPEKASRTLALAGRAACLCRWLWLRAAAVVAVVDHRQLRADGAELFRSDRDAAAREKLAAADARRESGVDPRRVPRHVAVIMDGNRRYGRARHGDAARGHWDGARTLLAFAGWCIAEGVGAVTVYAFSTENWDRAPAEVAALMAIFRRYCDELRVEAVRRGIRVRVLTTDPGRIPEDVRAGVDRLVAETARGDRLAMNVCLSYSGRGEIVNACRSVAADARAGRIDPARVGEADVRERMLLPHCGDPDVVIRTSGEERLSNFLLWHVAYSELFFLKKPWPEVQKEDLLDVIRAFAHGRERRYGK